MLLRVPLPPLITIAGLTLQYTLTVNGVATDGTFTFTGGPYADVAALVAAMGLHSRVTATDATGKLSLSTNLTGRLQSIVVQPTGTANTVLNFSTSAAVGGAGTDVSFNNIAANLLTSGQTYPPTTSLTGTSLTIEVSSDGGLTFPTTKSHSFSGSAQVPRFLQRFCRGDAAFAGTTRSFCFWN